VSGEVIQAAKIRVGMPKHELTVERVMPPLSIEEAEGMSDEQAKFAMAEFFRGKIERIKEELAREGLEPEHRKWLEEDLEHMLRAQLGLKSRLGN
jgi:hypothetical protein